MQVFRSDGLINRDKLKTLEYGEEKNLLQNLYKKWIVLDIWEVMCCK